MKTSIYVYNKKKRKVSHNTKLTGIAFGQALPESKDFSYVGGPNTTVEMGQQNGFCMVKCGFLL